MFFLPVFSLHSWEQEMSFDIDLCIIFQKFQSTSCHHRRPKSSAWRLGLKARFVCVTMWHTHWPKSYPDRKPLRWMTSLYYAKENKLLNTNALHWVCLHVSWLCSCVFEQENLTYRKYKPLTRFQKSRYDRIFPYNPDRLLRSVNTFFRFLISVVSKIVEKKKNNNDI